MFDKTQGMTPEEIERLMPFGFAPGLYSHPACPNCGIAYVGDKRASICRECAETLADVAAAAKSQPPTIPPTMLDAATNAITFGLECEDWDSQHHLRYEAAQMIVQAALEAANVPALADILRRIIASADECDGSDGVGVPLVSIDARLIAEVKEMLK